MNNHIKDNPFLDEYRSDFFKSTQLQDNGLLIKSKSEPSLEEFKRALIAILQGQLKKSISDDFIDLNEELLIKGKSYPVGTVREWQGKKFRKVSQGKWMRVYTGEESRGEKQAIANTIKKIQAATSIEELARIVNQNRKRFLTESGKTHPVVERLLGIAKHTKEFGRGKMDQSRKESKEKKESVNKKPDFKIQDRKTTAEFEKWKKEDKIRNAYTDLEKIKGSKDYVSLPNNAVDMDKAKEMEKQGKVKLIPEDQFSTIIQGLDKKEVKPEAKKQSTDQSGKGLDKLDLSPNNFFKKMPIIINPRYGNRRFLSGFHNDAEKDKIAMTDGKQMLVLKRTEGEKEKFGNENKTIGIDNEQLNENNSRFPPYEKVMIEDNETTVKTNKSIGDIQKQLQSIKKDFNNFKKRLKEESFNDLIENYKSEKKVKVVPEKILKKMKRDSSYKINNDFDSNIVYMDKKGNVFPGYKYDLNIKEGISKFKSFNYDTKKEGIKINADLLNSGMKTINNLRGDIKDLKFTTHIGIMNENSKPLKISNSDGSMDYILMPMLKN